MTITQAHIEFREAMDRLDSSAYPDFLSEQVDYILNEAYNRFIKTRYSGNNPARTSMEQTQKRIDDLRNLLITNFAGTSVNSTETNTYNVSLTSLYTNEARSSASTTEYMFYIRGRVKVTNSACGSNYVPLRIYTHDEVDIVLTDPFKKPVIYEPIGYFEGNNLCVITDGTFTVDNFKLSYIKIPTPVSLADDITFETAPHTHKEIITIATYVALENIESMRQQTQLQAQGMIE
jgi:hypothetical protein